MVFFLVFSDRYTSLTDRPTKCRKTLVTPNEQSTEKKTRKTLVTPNEQSTEKKTRKTLVIPKEQSTEKKANAIPQSKTVVKRVTGSFWRRKEMGEPVTSYEYTLLMYRMNHIEGYARSDRMSKEQLLAFYKRAHMLTQIIFENLAKK